MARKKETREDEDKQFTDAELNRAIPPGGGTVAVPTPQQYISILNAHIKVFKNPDEAIRHSRENARAMRRDLCVMEPLTARQLAVAELPWHIESEDKRDPEQIKCVKEITRIIEEIPCFLRWKKALLEAVFFGRYAVQNSYGWDFSTGRKRLVIKDWEPIHGDSLEFKWNNDYRAHEVGVLVNQSYFGPGTKKLTTGLTDVTRAHFLTNWEREAFVIHSHNIEAGDFFEPEVAGSKHGIGLRTYIYWTYYLRQTVVSWMQDYMEKVGTGITIWYFDQGNPESEKAVRMAAEAQAFESVILYPRPIGTEKQGAGLERYEPSSAAIDNLMRVIDYYGSLIKRMIVGQVLSSESGEDTPASSGTASFQEDTFTRIIKFDATNLEDTINRDLISVLMKYNYPTADYKVKFKFNVDRPDPEKYLKAAREYYNMGGDIDADDLREIIGLSKPTKDSVVLRRVMNAMEEGQQMGTGGEQSNNAEAMAAYGKEGGEAGKAVTKRETVKQAINTLGADASTQEVKEYIENSTGKPVSMSTVYNVLRELRGRAY